MNTSNTPSAQVNCALMTGNGIMPFQNSELNCTVRTIEKDGEPLFVGKDVCIALGYANETDAMNRHCKGVVKRYPLATTGGVQEVRVISEPDMMRLICGSRLESAQRFEAWVFEEVLPSIRKHGAYATDQLLNDPDLAIRAFTALKEEREKNKALAVKVAEDKPKVLFANAVADSENSVLVGELAKTLRQNSVDIGRNRLLDWMRENGYLEKKGENRGLPTQRSMNLGLLRIKKGSYTDPNGVNIVTRTVKVTGKGQQYFVNKFLGARDEELTIF